MSSEPNNLLSSEDYKNYLTLFRSVLAGDEQEDDLAELNERLLVEEYQVELRHPNSWLPDAEAVIEDLVLDGDGKGNLLANDVGLYARCMMQSIGDLLPGGPFKCEIEEGKLVLEFEGDNLRLTSVSSPDDSLFFGYSRNSEKSPEWRTIRRGSNSLRDEFHQFLKKISDVKDGEELAPEG